MIRQCGRSYELSGATSGPPPRRLRSAGPQSRSGAADRSARRWQVRAEARGKYDGVERLGRRMCEDDRLRGEARDVAANLDPSCPNLRDRADIEKGNPAVLLDHLRRTLGGPGSSRAFRSCRRRTPMTIASRFSAVSPSFVLLPTVSPATRPDIEPASPCVCRPGSHGSCLQSSGGILRQPRRDPFPIFRTMG